MIKNTLSSSFKPVFTAIALILVGQLTAVSQTKKPQVSPIDPSTIPSGCSYTLSDWKGNTLLWAPASYDSKNLIIRIDGKTRKVPFTRNDQQIIASSEEYNIQITNQEWKEAGYETSTAKAILSVIHTETNTQTQLIAKAIAGC